MKRRDKAVLEQSAMTLLGVKQFLEENFETLVSLSVANAVADSEEADDSDGADLKRGATAMLMGFILWLEDEIARVTDAKTSH